jgi:hypothetical protein
MIGYMDIDRQIDVMARTWPNFSLAERRGRGAIWVGQVRPLMQPYTISVGYIAPTVVELLDRRRMQPRVAILAPELRPRRGDPEGQLPHVYYTGEGPLDCVLCLFDPDSNEWSPSMALAETTVPWAIDWLAAYEGWRATGKWTATGKHVPRGMEMAG